MHEKKRIHSLADRIRQARLASEMSQSELARALGIKPQAVQQWENGASCPKTNRIPDVAAVLGVQASWLLVDTRQNEGLEHEHSPADWSQLKPDEQLILRMFRSMDEGHKIIFSEIAGVMAKK